MCHHISYTWCFFRILRIPLNLKPDWNCMESVNNWNGTTVKKLPTLWNMAVGGNWSTSVRRPSLPLWGIPSITSVIPPGEEHNQQLLCFSVTGAVSQLGVLCYMHYTGSISKWLLTAVHSAVALWHAKLVILLC